MKATTPPRAWASAMTCWQTVVLPDDSGPKISVIRPRGMPPTPSARSSAIEPGRDRVDHELLARAELHDRAAPELLLDRGEGGVDRLAAFGLVAFGRCARPSSPSVRHAPHPIRGTARRSGPRWRPPVDQPSSASSSTTVPFLARLADHLDVLRRLRERRQTRLGGLLPSASSSLCWVDPREPIAQPPRRLAAYRSILHADFSAHFTAAYPTRAKAQFGHRGGEGSGPDRGSDPGHEV